MSKECKAPGGGADPDRDKVWEDYRKRKAEAEVQKETKGKGKTKSKGKPKGKGGKGGQAKTVIDSARVAAARVQGNFPKRAVMLDSGANVHLSSKGPGL